MLESGNVVRRDSDRFRVNPWRFEVVVLRLFADHSRQLESLIGLEHVPIVS